ncbi:hypothetical protein SAMN05661096_04063 [Marivirga sericea]|uniref:Outer membrane protein beta-barrel domain-containing protein n=1 Tax=Marivirga sericea TaxID=1028 RepID=A0A1X7LI52_9BACT|nr:hypothetical protein [Marivirga sericea]SMG53217.1 hypothetical protein SAMN05661096_04063 [Marivirga sericea]
MKTFIVSALLTLISMVPLYSQKLMEGTKVSIGFESGLHLDVVELLRPSYKDNRPSIIPDNFELQKVYIGWNNRIRFNYQLSKKWELLGRIGFTSFKLEYQKSNMDILGGFGDKKYVVKYMPIDILITRNIYLKKGVLNIGFGPIVRIFSDSGVSYIPSEGPDGKLYVTQLQTNSRTFGDIGFSFNTSYSQQIKEALHLGLNLNAYTLFGGYGLESIILSPFVTINF